MNGNELIQILDSGLPIHHSDSMKKLAMLLMPLLLAACAAATPPVTQDVIIDSPAPNAVVTSPLTVTGKARGTWYFEASFPVRLLDDIGNELAIAPATAQGEWMTEDYVPFSATLEFETTVLTGTLELQKDNPSGMPENDASVRIPVRFKNEE